MSILSRAKFRLWWERASWVIPLTGIVLALMLNEAVRNIDEALYAEGAVQEFSSSAAITILAAIGGGMITFTGFVFSFVVLLLQFGSSAYSPRSVAYFLRARAVQWILALFLATITFSFLTLIDTGSLNREDFVPSGGVLLAIFLLLVSLIGFIGLLHVVGRRIRVDAVLSSIGESSQRALRRSARYIPRGGTATPIGEEATLALRKSDALPDDSDDGSEIVSYVGRNGQVVAVDVAKLIRLVRRRKCEIDVVVRVGDAVTPGTPIARVKGAPKPLDRRISAAIVVDSERSLVYDPLYALRLLVDVALRALSPAVNDPTTAVRSLDEIEGVLRVAARERMGAISFELDPGRLVVSRPTWTELVDLALVEILTAGSSEIQVHRRLVALVSDLIPAVAESLRPVLAEYRSQLLADAAEMPGRSGHIAGHGDRQGLGGSS